MKKLIAVVVVLVVGFFGSSFYIEGLNAKAHEEFKKVASSPEMWQGLIIKQAENNRVLREQMAGLLYAGSDLFLEFEDYQKGFLSSSVKFSLMTKTQFYDKPTKLLEGNITYYNLPLSKRFKAVLTKEGLEKENKELAQAIKSENLLEIEGFKTFFDWEVRMASGEFSHLEERKQYEPRTKKVEIKPMSLTMILDGKNPLLLKSVNADIPYISLIEERQRKSGNNANSKLLLEKLQITQSNTEPTSIFDTKLVEGTSKASLKNLEFVNVDAMYELNAELKLQEIESSADIILKDDKMTMNTKTNAKTLSFKDGEEAIDVELTSPKLVFSLKDINAKAWERFLNYQDFGVLEAILKEVVGISLDFQTKINKKDLSIKADAQVQQENTKLNAIILSEGKFSELANFGRYTTRDLEQLDSMASVSGKEYKIEVSLDYNPIKDLFPDVKINGKSLSEYPQGF
ncbi:hypothetical protein [Helicobacter burdigaliensis]|uniref:hypothetical protein n=1 Tax=Helicobacter burdigaliensis TaxID=2315334 RepID=UPI000EF66BB8|nr:hypothetical protein [Helicobacter burdigaliensis]